MAKHEAVLIRVSTDEQDHQGQIDNVKNMLAVRGIKVPQPYWHVYTVSRSKVSASDEFQKFIQQVETDEISTAYVESQDRFGQTDTFEYFSIIATLRSHGTRLIALRDNSDLTRHGIAEDVLAVVGAHNNDEKLRQSAYQSIRTRISNFKATGSGHRSAPLWLRQGMLRVGRCIALGMATSEPHAGMDLRLKRRWNSTRHTTRSNAGKDPA